VEALTFGDARLKAVLDGDEKQLTLQLTDVASGRAWPAVGLLTLEVHSRTEVRTVRLNEYEVLEAAPVDHGVHVTVRDAFRQVYVGLWLRIIDGELSVMIPPAELREDREIMYRVFGVEVLGGLMTAGPDGQLLLPINTGVLCSPAGKEKLSDSFLIYGEQSRWELLPTLPVCGSAGPDGGMGAVAVQGAEDMRCDVATDGKGSGRVGLAVTFRRHWPDPVDFGHREIRYLPLSPSEDLVHTVAKRLRRHVMEDHGKPTIAQRAAESPEVAYLLEAFIMKLFYGIQNQGTMMIGKDKAGPLIWQRVMSFAQAGQNLRRLKDAGVEKVYTQSVGWNPRGHDGTWPTRFPIEQRLGGERSFRELIELGKSLGYQMNIHDNYNAANLKSPDTNLEYVIHDINLTPAVTGCWGGGPKCSNWGLALPRERVEGVMAQMKALGLSGVHYMDGMGNPLYVNYHRTHGGPRGDHARGFVRYLNSSREIFGATGTECGFLYCAIPADLIVTGGSAWHMGLCSEDWPVTALLDKRVPVWDLALHGLLVKENHGEHWQGAMECVLMGDKPRTEWSAEPGIMPVLDDELIARIKGKFDICVKRFGHLTAEELTEWSAPADGVQQTRFADGTEVVADFNAQRLTVNGEPIERPAGL